MSVPRGDSTPLYGSPSLSYQLAEALMQGEASLDALKDVDASDRHDRFTALLAIYALATAPLSLLGDSARLVGSPALAAIKSRLERDWLAELASPAVELPDDPIAAMRRLAARDRLPAAYRWLAQDASWEELVAFLAVEGGPDGGFDDLVAACQLGLSGSAKLELARNYWDEMGNGRSAAVHTVMYEDMAAAIKMPHLAPETLPVQALERMALGGLLATNHWLQPEMIGALGLIELQAGPRCRLVLKAFDRLHAPSAAYPFYAEHATVDPRHGKDWLNNAITPLCEENPTWAQRIVRGAAWRSRTNAALFEILPAALPPMSRRPVAA